MIEQDYRLIKVNWQATGRRASIQYLLGNVTPPDIIAVPDHVNDNEVRDWLSNRYGFNAINWKCTGHKPIQCETAYSADPM